MRILVDTNILVRALNDVDPNRQLALDACDGLRRQGHALCVAPQNLYEFWSVATRPAAQNGLGKSADQAFLVLESIKSDFGLLQDAPAIFSEWEQLVVAYQVLGKPAHDARLVAAMLVHGVTRILTFNDKDFRRYPQITVLTPADAVSSSGSP